MAKEKKEDLESKIKHLKKEHRDLILKYQKRDYEFKYYKNQYNKEIKKRYTDERFIEEVKSALHVVKPLRPYKINIPETEHKPQELVQLFSDCHVGEKIQKKETKFFEYNTDIFGERLKNLYTSTINITDRHRKDFSINRLNVFMLGDLVEGRDIFRGQSSRVTTDIVEQMFEGQELIANYLRNISKHFKEVNVSCVPGNHGRVGRKDEELTHVNWDYVIYRNLEQILHRVKNIKFDVDKSWWKIEKVQGWNFYLEHGDQIMRYMGVPWYGLERRDGRLTMMLQGIDKVYDYYCIGHFHEPFEWDRARGERIGNGTFVGGNPFAARKLAAMSRPTQKLFGVHPEIGITFRYNVRLDLPKQYIK